MKHLPKTFLLILFPLATASCGIQTVSSLSIGPTIYGDKQTFSYTLVDDKEKGKAIYPDEALSKLLEIQSYIQENGVPWPEGSYSSQRRMIMVQGELLTDYDVEEETSVPGEYYFYQSDMHWLKIQAEGYFSYEGEFFYGEYGNPDIGKPYYTPSSKEEMNFHVADKTRRNLHYQDFLRISESIIEKEFDAIVLPMDYECYTQGEGSIYINIYHSFSSPNEADRRLICRIVYDHYVPQFAIYQKIDDIMGDEDYCNEAHSVRFTYGNVEIRDDLAAFFVERRN